MEAQEDNCIPRGEILLSSAIESSERVWQLLRLNIMFYIIQEL